MERVARELRLLADEVQRTTGVHLTSIALRATASAPGGGRRHACASAGDGRWRSGRDRSASGGLSRHYRCFSRWTPAARQRWRSHERGRHRSHRRHSRHRHRRHRRHPRRLRSGSHARAPDSDYEGSGDRQSDDGWPGHHPRRRRAHHRSSSGDGSRTRRRERSRSSHHHHHHHHHRRRRHSGHYPSSHSGRRRSPRGDSDARGRERDPSPPRQPRATCGAAVAPDEAPPPLVPPPPRPRELLAAARRAWERVENGVEDFSPDRVGTSADTGGAQPDFPSPAAGQSASRSATPDEMLSD